MNQNQALERYFASCTELEFTPPSISSRSLSGPLHDISMEKRIEHTLLRINATDKDVATLCEEAMRFGFRSVCCFPRDVQRCRSLLEGSSTLVVAVLNFPLAQAASGIPEAECKLVLDQGADEIDFVIDVRSLLQGDLKMVRDKAASIVKAAGVNHTKAILETGVLTDEQIVEGIAAVEVAGVTCAKTSTGFGPRGASVNDVLLMRLVCANRLLIKASGGIRDAQTAAALVKAGADLIGTSSGPAII